MNTTAEPNRPETPCTLSPRDKTRAVFPRSARLLKHDDFERVYRGGGRLFATHMTVFFLERPTGGLTRVGFTVGRALGGAVVRNRIRRRMREAVRLHLGTLSRPIDIVINPKKSALTADFQALASEVAKAFEKIGLSRAAKLAAGHPGTAQ